MSKKIACCGLDCGECLAYKATVSDSDELRKQTADQWSKMFNATIEPSTINCLGCKSDVLFSHCNVCEIRKCSLEKKLDNCGMCSQFSCDKVEGVLQHAPEARVNLEEIKKSQ